MTAIGQTTTLTTSVCPNGNGKKRTVTIHTGVVTAYPGMHMKPSTATYGNGVDIGDVTAAANTAVQNIIELLEVPMYKVGSQTAWDISTASVAAESRETVEAEIGKEYILRGSNLTIAAGQLIIRAASGLWAGVNVAHNTTILHGPAFQCTVACTTSTYVRGKFVGIVPYCTA